MIKTIILALFVGCFVTHTNAVTVKEIATKAPALLLLSIIQLPNTMSKAVTNISNNADGNVTNTINEILQHVIAIEQKVINIEDQVNKPSDYKTDKLLSIGISTIVLLGLGSLALVIWLCDKCKKQQRTNTTSIFGRRYGI